MRQVFSNQQTIQIQAGLSTVVMAVGIWWSYRHGIVPNYGGLLGWGEFVLVVWGWSFAGATVVGGAMWVTNLFFYHVQLLRHGPPSENVVVESELEGEDGGGD